MGRLIELDWSEQSLHIRSLYRPWQPGNGYDEATLQAAEARLGVCLPNTLRAFYRNWGRRRDLKDLQHHLADPDDLVLAAEVLIFCFENQSVVYWGVQREVLGEDNPPVVVTPSGPSGWEVASELNWTSSHTRLSDFLDDLTYLHAFHRGALHGGATPPNFPAPQSHQIAWLEEHWSQASANPQALLLIPNAVFGLSDSTSQRPDSNNIPLPPLYVRAGQALQWGMGCRVVANEADVLDEIGQALQITWLRRW